MIETQTEIKWTEKQIIKAFCSLDGGFISYRDYVCVPNLTTYVGGGEADLVTISDSRWMVEYEIKVSIADLKRDKRKDKHLLWEHYQNLVSELWYVLPEDIFNDSLFEHLPAYAGMITVSMRDKRPIFAIKKRAKRKDTARKLTDIEMFKIARLGCIRYWANLYKEG